MKINQKEIQTRLTRVLLNLIVLELLDSSPMHGYQINAAIRRSFGINFGPSTIYPLLSDLEKKDFVKPEWTMINGRARKTFTLTAHGKAMLECSAGSLKAICRTLGTEKAQTHDPTNCLEINLAQSPRREQTYHILGVNPA